MLIFFLVLQLAVLQLIHRLSSANQFTVMRIKSNGARGTFRQLRLAVRLTHRLYALRYRIEAIKSKLEVCFMPFSLPHHMINNVASAGN